MSCTENLVSNSINELYHRSCIGWKFALQELQAFIVELVANFEFSMTMESNMIRREACLVMVPTIEGQIEKGSQLPLRVRVASRDDVDR